MYASNIGTSNENWKFEVENITPVRRDITYEGSLSTTSRTSNYHSRTYNYVEDSSERR